MTNLWSNLTWQGDDGEKTVSSSENGCPLSKFGVDFFFGNSPAEPSSTCFFFSEWTKSPGKSSAWAHGRSVKHGISLGCVYKQPPKNASKKRTLKKTDRLFWARDLAENSPMFLKSHQGKKMPPKEKKRFAAILCLWPFVWDGQKLLVTKVTSKKTPVWLRKHQTGLEVYPKNIPMAHLLTRYLETKSPSN